MKNIRLLVLLILAGTLSVSAKKSEINLNKSIVNWTGNKIGGSHNGGIKIKSGHFEVKNGDIVAGNVVMDMNSITNFDLKDEGPKKRLTDHLKSDDFFGVEKFPTSTFEVTESSKFKDGKATVTGVLTIKGKSENISAEVFKNGDTYTSQLKVDRSKYDVRYGSKSFFDNIGNRAIDDIFTLDIQLVFQ